MLPIIFESSWLTLYSYPFFVGLAWGIAYQMASGLLPAKLISIKKFNYLMAGNFIFAWIGAKIFFLLFSAGSLQSYYLGNKHFWLGGGMVFYGGLILATLFSLLYTRLYLKVSLEELSFLIPGLVLGHAIGRVGCFFTGCCFGQFCNIANHEFRLPVQLFEALGLTVLFMVLRNRYLQGERSKVIWIYFYSYGLLRFSLEFLRDDYVRGGFGPFSTSQWISIGILTLVGISQALLKKMKLTN